MTGPDARGVFACASGVFAHTLLGVHDGRESWTVMVGRERSPTEQLLVSLHEKKHHELHTSSPWGLFMMTAGAPPSMPAMRRSRSAKRPSFCAPSTRCLGTVLESMIYVTMTV